MTGALRWLVSFCAGVFRLFLSLILTALVLPSAALRIVVRDETGHFIWARVEVRGPDFQMFQPTNAIMDHAEFSANRRDTDRYYLGSFVVEGQTSLDLPPGHYKVIAEHGLEYGRHEEEVDVAAEGPSAVLVQLRPWIRMRERGWYSGDMHVHRSTKDAAALSLAEDLNICVIFTMWDKDDLWGDESLRVPIIRVTPDHFLTLWNAEDERGGGAWMLHNIRAPLGLGGGARWYPPGIRFVRAARRQKASPEALFPWFDSEKPIWWEVPVMMALAPPDSLGVVHNHFNQYNTLSSEVWGRPRNQEEFPGQEGFAKYCLGLYYRYLNLGFHLPPSAGSASGVLPAPVGYNRMYVPVSGPLTVEKWYAAVRAGKVLVTNGPILFFDIIKSHKYLKAMIEAHAREPIDRIEVVGNGEVLRELKPVAGTLDFVKEVELDPGNHSWVAARCFLKTGGTVRFAHTSAIYLLGNWDASADARYFIGWIDELIELTNSDRERFRSDSEKQEILRLYREAREFYVAKAQPAPRGGRRPDKGKE